MSLGCSCRPRESQPGAKGLTWLPQGLVGAQRESLEPERRRVRDQPPGGGAAAGPPPRLAAHSWTAFPQDPPHAAPDVEQWWPTSAVEAGPDGLPANQNLRSVFAEAFPPPPGPSSGGPPDPPDVPTLKQLLRSGAGQDQGLLDGFHDLNKMIGQRYRRASSASRDLLLRTLHLEAPPADSRAAPWTAPRPPSLGPPSPGPPSARQHAQHAAKRRLSYDHNRNVTE
ncbi:uncharacterized protein ACNS7B_015068 [Menidia menidia]